MFIPFSDNDHVSDSIVWISISCPSLVARRTAKRRRTERTIESTTHTRRKGWFAESARRFSCTLILVANVYERSILVTSVGFPGPAAESPLVLCITQRLVRFRNYLESVFRNEVAEALMALALQVVSSHLLGALDLEKALSVQKVPVNRLLPHAASEAETLKWPNCPRLFLLDGCSINLA